MSDLDQVQKLIDAYRPTADALMAEGAALLSAFERAAADARARAFVAVGAPPHLAETVAMLRPLTATTDVADLARTARWDALSAARLYHAVGEAFGFERLRAAAASIRGRDPFERQAVRELILEMFNEQAQRVRVIAATSKRPPTSSKEAVDGWTASRRSGVDRALGMLAEIEQSPDGWSFAKLTLCAAAIKAAAAAPVP
jgi:glutamate dehydrogenase